MHIAEADDAFALWERIQLNLLVRIFKSMEIYLPILAVVMILAGGFTWQSNSYLLRNGRKTDGIVFKNNLSGRAYYPVVRFLTDNQTWVTQELKMGSTSARKEGATIKVIYNPDDPTQVEIDSIFTLQVLPVIFIVIGIILLSYSILQLLGFIKETWMEVR